MRTIHGRLNSRNARKGVRRGLTALALTMAGLNGIKEDKVMACGNCKNCMPNDVCDGDHICRAKEIEVAADDDIRFYGEKNDEPCEKFREAR